MPSAPAPAPGVETTFDALFTSWTPNTGTAVVAKPAQSKPGSKAANLSTPSYTSAFGVPVFRATQVSDSPDGVAYLIHDSSRRQAKNCDNTRFVARATNSYWYLYDASTFAVLSGGRTVSQGLGALGSGASGAVIGDCELWWHPTDPNKFYWMGNNGGMQIFLFDIVSKTSTTAVNLTGRLGAFGMGTATRVTTRAEGRPSDDGRYAAFMVRDAGDGMLGLICVDIPNDTIVGSLVTTNLPDHVSMSPAGNYVVVSWSGGTGMDYSVAAAAAVNSTNGVRAYNRTFSSFTQINTYGEHSDLGIDTLGNEVIVTVCFTFRMGVRGVADGDIYYARLDNGACTVLPVGTMYDGGSTAVHFNCASTKQSGFAVVSMQAGSGNAVSTWNDECVMLVELAPSAAKHLRLVHHHTAYVDEWSAPEATINRDGTRVTFRTNFGASNVESYVAALPSDWKTRVGFG